MKTFTTLLIYAAVLSGWNSTFAQTWTPTGAPTNIWGPIAMSADGSKLATLYYGSGAVNVIWVSTNGGISWASNSIPGVSNVGRLLSACWSASGDKLAAVASFNSSIYTSTNYGVTWATNSVPSETWFRIASSADGTRLVAVAGNINPGPIYVSTDSGQTWTPANAPVTNWVSVAASANGSNWVAAVETSAFTGTLYTSTDGGLDWTLMTSAPNVRYYSVASSADGTKFIAATEGPIPAVLGAIYTSTNSGASWISNSLPNEHWSGVASSADGRVLAAIAFTDNYGNSGFVYTSTNYGTTWNTLEKTPSQNWEGIASSADGGSLVACGATALGSSSGSIYILQTIPPPELNITSANSNLALSWTIPSTNFVLQQSPDLISWNDLTNTPMLNLTNLQNQIVLSPANSSGFFRLSTP